MDMGRSAFTSGGLPKVALQGNMGVPTVL